jgi:myo-inositol-1(or 4)-monophosphatase
VSELPRSASGKTAGEVARLCAEEAGRLIMERFPGRGGRGRAETAAKGRGNFVTETDLASEKAVVRVLAEEYPEHEVLSEEMFSSRPPDMTKPWLWVVDPIDGTHNFAQGIPHFAFNIALCHEQEPVLGLTTNPAVGDEFYAEAGDGLLVNGSPARASDTRTLAEGVWFFEMGYHNERAAKMLSLVQDVWPRVQAVRAMGSAALGLAYAACGRSDLVTTSLLAPWDLAAGIVQVREGGGVIVGRDGDPVTLFHQGVAAGAAGPVRDFLRVQEGKDWR